MPICELGHADLEKGVAYRTYTGLFGLRFSLTDHSTGPGAPGGSVIAALVNPNFLTTGRTTVDIIRPSSIRSPRALDVVCSRQELIQLQSEFISRQAQALAEQSKHLEQSFVQAAKEMRKTTSHDSGGVSKGAEAA